MCSFFQAKAPRPWITSFSCLPGPCGAVLCRAMLCWVVLCCAVLYCAVLCKWGVSPGWGLGLALCLSWDGFEVGRASGQVEDWEHLALNMSIMFPTPVPGQPAPWMVSRNQKGKINNQAVFISSPITSTLRTNG